MAIILFMPRGRRWTGILRSAPDHQPVFVTGSKISRPVVSSTTPHSDFGGSELTMTWSKTFRMWRAVFHPCRAKLEVSLFGQTYRHTVLRKLGTTLVIA